MCETIMEAVSLTKHFRSADKTWFTAVDGASISLQKGKTLCLGRAAAANPRWDK